MSRGETLNTPDQQARRDLEILRTKVENLTGERGDAKKTMSAIRRLELQPLASLALQSTQIAATPTQAQYNALQIDVKNIFDALKTISNVLGTATISKI
ncbi:hypothetical protein UFOVP275_17 [uncultured Caudovirales phage]|uniref:Uncharacterized protein n=1 Tax=uncultured Caudovirales phage TaxID=2100421 RepID=A0A6J5LKQ3_9CAUD|nr:hypothetical protein UFOVP275_17 [uncultured Caudovirales phage]